MSRHAAVQRTLTLTEELERLEQSITLTLQEIDSNFSKAHRIVTGSILPVVGQYAEQSKGVWEGSKFWKQFFELSANVSLSGYEESPPDAGIQQAESLDESTYQDHRSSAEALDTTDIDQDASSATPSACYNTNDDEPDLSALSITPSKVNNTPRMAATYGHDNEGSDLSSPSYGNQAFQDTVINTQSPVRAPMTPGPSRTGRTQRYAEVTPISSPLMPPSSTARHNQEKDLVLHRLFDKKYRIQATPLNGKTSEFRPRLNPQKTAETPKLSFNLRAGAPHPRSPSPPSSPELEAPKLHEEIFSSPIRDNSGENNRLDLEDPALDLTRELDSDLEVTPARFRKPTVSPGKVKPGISVLTPAKSKPKPNVGAAPWDSDDDDVDLLMPSPPKTMQFHVPQSRLMQTPAKEASHRIVSDLLYSAGVRRDPDVPDIGESTEEIVTPNVVRHTEFDDESF